MGCGVDRFSTWVLVEFFEYLHGDEDVVADGVDQVGAVCEAFIFGALSLRLRSFAFHPAEDDQANEAD